MSFITKHGYQRCRERSGLKRNSINRMIDRILANGVCHADTSGSLRLYMDYLYLSHGNGNNNRIYGDHVYIIEADRLITVLPLPRRFKSAVQKITKHKNVAIEAANI